MTIGYFIVLSGLLKLFLVDKSALIFSGSVCITVTVEYLVDWLSEHGGIRII